MTTWLRQSRDTSAYVCSPDSAKYPGSPVKRKISPRTMNILPSARLTYACFEDADVPALAGLLADPGITRNITANGSTPELCREFAARRIAWHNGSWDSHGYGVWALRPRSADLAPTGRLLGWCGFATPDDEGADPEILYAIDADYRGLGLASEAARHAIGYLFETTGYAGVTAIISTRLNPGSVKVVENLGFARRGRMRFDRFLSEPGLADEVLDYEIWRLAEVPADDIDRLLEQVAFRAGQSSTVATMDPSRARDALVASLGKRQPARSRRQRLERKLVELFDAGRENAYMDCYRLGRDRWLDSTGA